MTTDVDRVALHWSLALEQLDYYINHLYFIEHENKLDTICEDENLEAMVDRLMYQLWFLFVCACSYLVLTWICDVWPRVIWNFQALLLSGLNMAHGLESLKWNLALEKESHNLTLSKYVLLLAKATKYEGEAIDKSEKLTKAVSELNDFAQCVDDLKEDKRKAEATLEASNRWVAKIDCLVAKLEEAKGELDAIENQLTSSVDIGYRLAMESFKKETKKRDLGEYYYRILDIPITLPCEPI